MPFYCLFRHASISQSNLVTSAGIELQYIGDISYTFLAESLYLSYNAEVWDHFKPYFKSAQSMRAISAVDNWNEAGKIELISFWNNLGNNFAWDINTHLLYFANNFGFLYYQNTSQFGNNYETLLYANGTYGGDYTSWHANITNSGFLLDNYYQGNVTAYAKGSNMQDKNGSIAYGLHLFNSKYTTILCSHGSTMWEDLSTVSGRIQTLSEGVEINPGTNVTWNVESIITLGQNSATIVVHEEDFNQDLVENTFFGVGNISYGLKSTNW